MNLFHNQYVHSNNNNNQHHNNDQNRENKDEKMKNLNGNSEIDQYITSMIVEKYVLNWLMMVYILVIE